MSVDPLATRKRSGDTVGQTHAAPWGAAAMWVPWHPVQGVFQDVRPSIALVVNELALIRELHDEGLRRAHGSGKRYGDPRFVEVFRRTSVVRSLDELERLAYELNRYLRRIRYAGEQRHVVDVVHVRGTTRRHRTSVTSSTGERTEANRVEWLVGLYQERGARPGVTLRSSAISTSVRSTLARRRQASRSGASGLGDNPRSRAPQSSSSPSPTRLSLPSTCGSRGKPAAAVGSGDRSKSVYAWKPIHTS